MHRLERNKQFNQKQNIVLKRKFIIHAFNLRDSPVMKEVVMSPKRYSSKSYGLYAYLQKYRYKLAGIRIV
jgi:hypothetical protein